MKAGPCSEKLAEAVDKLPGARVYAVKDCGLSGEEVFDDIHELPGDYMLTVIVKE